jgi:hypothetical protein
MTLIAESGFMRTAVSVGFIAKPNGDARRAFDPPCWLTQALSQLCAGIRHGLERFWLELDVYPRVERPAFSRNRDTPGNVAAGHGLALAEIGSTQRVVVELVKEVLDSEV